METRTAQVFLINLLLHCLIHLRKGCQGSENSYT